MAATLMIDKPLKGTRKPKVSAEKMPDKVRLMIGEKVSSFFQRKRIFNSFMCVLNKMVKEYGYKPQKIDMHTPMVGSLVIVTHFNAMKFTWHYNW